ncbi:MAG: pseudouridine-5'-phosphate glycosidase [Pseudomonadota bacterium]
MILPMNIAPEVSDALAGAQPVVALESTIISHGMPHPRNIETARAVEDAVRVNGAVPATIAVIDGRISVGLDDTALERLGRPGARDIAKLSRRDLAACVAGGGMGATTVATTMIVAHMAGIEVFATGGIGGVHRGAELSFDVSADLQELARTPVSVVCAGAKAILDVPKTLEVLETLGVPVLTFGQTAFPGFWSRTALPLDTPRVDTAADIARRIDTQRRLGLTAGHLIANPIPAEAEIPAAELTPMIEQAIADAARHGMTGATNTPYVLQRIFELSGGRSLDANIALVLNNARLAAEIAKEVCALRKTP